MNTITRLFKLSFLALALPLISLMAQGNVYLVLGSDTAIWDDMDVAKYSCTYNLGLYDNPAMNAYKVMDPAFRAQFKDSYGQPMKMTWWMMAGNIFRFATNKNMPIPNIMTLYLMKKYHGDKAKTLGDELSLHYHTFTWTDYNKDGTYYWNQAKNFTECKDDFNVTVAQFLLEENTFPVSFRSGWHYMDNEWQNYLDKLLPYSLHNAYPSVRTTVVEPIDNVYDWSRSSKEFVPFHPSLSDYQIAGTAKGWNTRSIYMASITQAQMDEVFLKAKNGVDQLPCIWAHLPEADFPQNMKRVDSLAHISAAKYPTVKFSYCTAVEAIQKWRKGNDTTAPAVTLEEVVSGDMVGFTIHTDENIFQAEPFVAMKDVYEEYLVLPCIKTGDNQWMTRDLVSRASIAKVGVAVTDTMGNLSTKFLSYYPDDIFIDNLDNAYHEVSGAWTSTPVRSWGTDSRQCVLAAGDSAIANWKPAIQVSKLYNLFIQIPKLNAAANSLLFRIFAGSQLIDSVRLHGPFSDNDWIYVTTVQLTGGGDHTIQLAAYGSEQPGKTVSADVLKLSALVKERSIYVKQKNVQLGPVSEEDTARYSLRVENRGIRELTISQILWNSKSLMLGVSLPVVIPGMKAMMIPISFYASTIGEVRDTLVFKSDDPKTPMYSVALSLIVQPYFATVDNEDSLSYTEKGSWAKSNAQAWGASSRYAISGTGASASFRTTLKKSGIYEVYEIVPATANAITNALYVIKAVGDSIGSVVIDQNKRSGSWTSLGRYTLPSSVQVEVDVIDNRPPVANRVLRADAIKFQLVTATPVTANHMGGMINDFQLYQNYPNPFNPSTVIRYAVPRLTQVTLKVYDVLGKEVRTLVDEEKLPGDYTVRLDVPRLSSGVYFYHLQAGNYWDVKKMLVMR